MQKFLLKYKVINDSQYGFKPNSSTECAMTNQYNSLLKSSESKKFSLGIFIDLKKYFMVP